MQSCERLTQIKQRILYMVRHVPRDSEGATHDYSYIVPNLTIITTRNAYLSYQLSSVDVSIQLPFDENTRLT